MLQLVFEWSAAEADQVEQLTQQDDDAQQDGDERPRAEAHRQEDGLGAARQQRAVRLAAAHPDGQRARAALGRVAVVLDHHRQQVDLLQAPPEAAALGHDSRRVVCQEGGRVGGEEKETGERENVE